MFPCRNINKHPFSLFSMPYDSPYHCRLLRAMPQHVHCIQIVYLWHFRYKIFQNIPRNSPNSKTFQENAKQIKTVQTHSKTFRNIQKKHSTKQKHSKQSSQRRKYNWESHQNSHFRCLSFKHHSNI